MNAEDATKPATKRNTTPLHVYCLPDQREAIKAKAQQAGLSVSEYMLTVSLGYPVPSKEDKLAVLDLLKVAGDLGRLGGLLKLWLNNDHKTMGLDINEIKKLISSLVTSKNELDLKIQLLAKNIK